MRLRGRRYTPGPKDNNTIRYPPEGAPDAVPSPGHNNSWNNQAGQLVASTHPLACSAACVLDSNPIDILKRCSGGMRARSQRSPAMALLLLTSAAGSNVAGTPTLRRFGLFITGRHGSVTPERPGKGRDCALADAPAAGDAAEQASHATSPCAAPTWPLRQANGASQRLL